MKRVFGCAFLFVLGIGLCCGCGVNVEFAPSFSAKSSVKSGAVERYYEERHYPPYWAEMDLNVPDGSPLLQYTNPVADLLLTRDTSTRTVSGVPCSLSASGGSRSFSLAFEITVVEYRSPLTITVKDVYDK
jgi:hypothetical protein